MPSEALIVIDVQNDFCPGGALPVPGRPAYETIKLDYGTQVLWPSHCVQLTPGADFHPDLGHHRAQMIVRKGTKVGVDSYSGFFENDHKTSTGLGGGLRELGVKSIVLVGLATDFCVKYTALDGRSLGFDVTVIRGGCRGIDIDGSLDAAWDEMAQAGVHFR